jgi:alanine racemase
VSHGASAPPATIEERLAAAGLPPLPRPAWLEIDTDALAANLRVMRRLARGAAVTAVVKADGYGHGIEVAARTFLAAGADSLGVATLDEALHLRASGIEGRIIVLFSVPAPAVRDAAAAGIELVAADRASLAGIEEALRQDGVGRPLAVHLEIETGLSRAGFRPVDAAVAAERIAALAGARLASVWSHLATPEDGDAVAAQVERFESAVTAITAVGVPVPERHLSATGGLLVGAPPYERVRVGLAIYGAAPELAPTPDGAAAATALRPAMALRARPIRVERLAAGESVGYGGTWTAPRASTIATLPVGYGDGWVRAYAGADVLVRGRRVPLVGTIAMDACMVDVSGLEAVGRDETFTLLGADGEAGIDASELARRRNTIAWEVLASMATRVPRVYHAPAGPTGTRTIRGEVAAGGPLSGNG